MKVFLIADHHQERDLFQLTLRHSGVDVASSGNLKHVLEHWWDNWANLILLAIDDPSDIIEQVHQIRAVTQVALLIVIDPLPEAQLCAILEARADLILARPVSARVLASYVQVFLRRTESVPAFVLPVVVSDEIKLDPATRTVSISKQQPRRLTHLEFNLLYLLMTNQDQVIPTDVIVERVWGYSGKGDRELVRGLVSRLRHKLEPETSHSHFIQNIPGVGYRFSLQN